MAKFVSDGHASSVYNIFGDKKITVWWPYRLEIARNSTNKTRMFVSAYVCKRMNKFVQNFVCR